MPDLRPSASVALVAALPLTDPNATAEHLTSWLVDRPAAPKSHARAWEHQGPGAPAGKATVATLTALEDELVRVVTHLIDRQPDIRLARGVELVVAACSKATAPLCLAALAVIGDAEYLEGRV